MIATNPHRDVWIDVDGIALHHVDHGGNGAAIVLLHGVTGHAGVWSAVAPQLTDLGHVRALDLRGMGDSGWHAGLDYRTEQHARDVLAILDALDVAEASIVGSSWGALVGIAVAHAVPARVARLAIVDVEPSFAQTETDVPPRPRSFASLADVVAAERVNNPHAPEWLLHTIAANGTRPGHDGTRVPKHDPFFFTRWPFRSDDWWGALPEITCPTLVVHAGASFVRREVTEQMAVTIPKATHVEIPDSTHVVPVDQPDALVSVLRDAWS